MMAAQAQAQPRTQPRSGQLGSEFKLTAAWPIDYSLLGAVLVLLGLGLVMVGSASVSIADQQLGEPFYYLWRQLLFVGVGLALAAIVLRVPMHVWEAISPALIIISMILLALVFIPGLGRTVNGSTRWLAFGSFNFQASEIVKLFSIIYLAGYLVRHHVAVRNSLRGFIKPLLLLQVLVVLLILEPDYGAVVVLLGTAMAMMWLGGVRILQFGFLLACVSGLLWVLAIISPYRMDRLTTFINPWADPLDSGYQLTQALIAFGRGEWFGVGLGASVQKLFYLPEAHTDFLFAVLAEELGLVMAVLVIALFAIVVLRALHIGRQAEQRERPFTGYLAYGIGLWIGMQAFINIGVNMGVLPTKGLTLPLMSYGGSSIVVMCIAVALLLRADYETRRHDRAIQTAGGEKW